MVGYADQNFRACNKMDIYPVKLRNRAVPEEPIRVYSDYAHSLIGGDDAPDASKATPEDYGVQESDMDELEIVEEFDMGDMD